MKEAFYFPHDSNAIQDPKMMTLLAECGAYGVGLYWVLIEVLHQQEWGAIGYPQAQQYLAFYGRQGAWNQLTLDKCEKVLFDTKLLVLEDGMVTSSRVKNNLKKREDLRILGKNNALKRWGANGVPLATQCDPNAIKERKGKNNTPIVPKRDELFETFWKGYPKKVGKGAAEKSWKKISDLERVFERIQTAVAAQSQSEQWQKEGGQYIPNPATWLNQRRWEDEIQKGEESWQNRLIEQIQEKQKAK